MTYTRYLYLAFYTPGMEKTRQDKNFIYTTQKKKTLAKDNTTYVRYKSPLAKKLIQLEAQVENNVKNKQTNKEKKRKNAYVQN